jgi:hypothetical protein
VIAHNVDPHVHTYTNRISSDIVAPNGMVVINRNDQIVGLQSCLRSSISGYYQSDTSTLWIDRIVHHDLEARVFVTGVVWTDTNRVERDGITAPEVCVDFGLRKVGMLATLRARPVGHFGGLTERPRSGVAAGEYR